MLILFYRRRFSWLGYSRNLHKLCCLCLSQGLVAGLLRPRPFLGKLLKATESSVSGTAPGLWNCWNASGLTRDEGHDVEVVHGLGDGEEGEDEGEHGDGGQARYSPCPQQIFRLHKFVQILDDLALEHLTANAKVAFVLHGSIPASFDTVESEGRQMGQCWIKYWTKILASVNS